MNIQYNVIGKSAGAIVFEKRGLTYPDARDLLLSWEQRGCSMIVDEQRKQVMFDRVEIQPVEVLWSRELDEADKQRELVFEFNKVVEQDSRESA